VTIRELADVTNFLAELAIVGSEASITRFAVRRCWPDGAHDFIKLRRTPKAAQDAIESDRRYWRRGLWRPSEYRVVAISRHDFDLHHQRPRCKAPDCA
jgi:hypothetical protein